MSNVSAVTETPPCRDPHRYGPEPRRSTRQVEIGGVKESQVVVRFWIVTMMLVLFGLSTLKLR